MLLFDGFYVISKLCIWLDNGSKQTKWKKSVHQQLEESALLIRTVLFLFCSKNLYMHIGCLWGFSMENFVQMQA